MSDLSPDEEALVEALRAIKREGYGELTATLKNGEITVYKTVSRVFQKELASR